MTTLEFSVYSLKFPSLLCICGRIPLAIYIQLKQAKVSENLSLTQTGFRLMNFLSISCVLQWSQTHGSYYHPESHTTKPLDPCVEDSLVSKRTCAHKTM